MGIEQNVLKHAALVDVDGSEQTSEAHNDRQLSLNFNVTKITKEPSDVAPMKPREGRFEKIAREAGQLTDEKNRAYGDSFHKAGEFLTLLYPNGITPDKYTDALCLVRIFDKLMRIGTKKDAFGESPYKDILGYALLGLDNDEKQKALLAPKGEELAEKFVPKIEVDNELLTKALEQVFERDKKRNTADVLALVCKQKPNTLVALLEDTKKSNEKQILLTEAEWYERSKQNFTDDVKIACGCSGDKASCKKCF